MGRGLGLAQDIGTVLLLRNATHSSVGISLLQRHAGCIPSELCQLRALVHLDVSRNQLTGEAYALVSVRLELMLCCSGGRPTRKVYRSSSSAGIMCTTIPVGRSPCPPGARPGPGICTKV